MRKLNDEQLRLLQAMYRWGKPATAARLAFQVFGRAFGSVAYCEGALPRLAKRGLVHKPDAGLWVLTQTGRKLAETGGETDE